MIAVRAVGAAKERDRPNFGVRKRTCADVARNWYVVRRNRAGGGRIAKTTKIRLGARMNGTGLVGTARRAEEWYGRRFVPRVRRSARPARRRASPTSRSVLRAAREKTARQRKIRRVRCRAWIGRRKRGRPSENSARSPEVRRERRLIRPRRRSWRRDHHGTPRRGLRERRARRGRASRRPETRTARRKQFRVVVRSAEASWGTSFASWASVGAVRPGSAPPSARAGRRRGANQAMSAWETAA
jgi:hypothetical protein